MENEKFTTRFRADFTNRKFIAVKLLYFLIYGGMNTLFPFLTIQARSLGIREDELGIIYALLPAVAVFAPPLAGMVADKIGNFKVFLSITIAVTGLTPLTYLFVPPARVSHYLPELLPMSINCTSSGEASLSVIRPYDCNYVDLDSVSLAVTQCKYRCSNTNDATLLSLEGGNATWCTATNNCPSRYSYDTVTNKVFKDEGENGFDENAQFSRGSDNYAYLNMNINRNGNSTHLTLKEPFCSNFNQLTWNKENGTENDCWMECHAHLNSSQACQNILTIDDGDISLTLGTYIIVRLINALCMAIGLPLFEGATVAILKEHKGDFGFQRLYVNLGQLMLTPISGKLIDIYSSERMTDFSPAFYLYCGINLIGAMVILFIDLSFKKPSNSVVKDFKDLLASAEVICFILIGFISGVTLGVIETFLFWILEDMGADKSLMGFTVTVGAACGIPILLFSTAIIKKLGHVNTITFGFSFFVIRLIGYSIIAQPWWVMPFEGLEGFTISLLSVATTSYAAVLSSSSTVASLQGLNGAVTHGVGRGTGSLLGGFLTSKIGLRKIFQLMAIVCAFTAVIYFILNLLFFRKNDLERRNKEKQKKEDELEKINEEKQKKEEVKENLKMETLQKIEQDNTNIEFTSEKLKNEKVEV